MTPQDIVQWVKSIEVRDLTEATFEEFIQGAHGLFVPKGARFQEYFSITLQNFNKNARNSGITLL